MLQYQPHPNVEAAKAGLIICTFEGCVIAGVGKSNEEALSNFILSINRLEAGRQMSVRGCLIAEGKIPMPGQAPVEQAPVKEEPLIVTAGVTPEQLEKLRAAKAAQGQ